MSGSMIRSTTRRGFDFTLHLRPVWEDMAQRLPELSHIDPARVATGFSQVRNGAAHGVLATMTPMRFEGGAETTTRRGRKFTAQRLLGADGQEMLYILTVFLPRFMNHTLQEKIATLIHELWHISPDFNGDLRRFAGRCYAHGPSQAAFDKQVDLLAEKWWSLAPPEPLYAFLKHDFRSLQAAEGRVYGTRIARPKLIPVSE